jgi:hypothetical protein
MPQWVVLLGYTSTFMRTDQWRNHARYVMADNQVCGVRLESELEDVLTFVLYFGTNVEARGPYVIPVPFREPSWGQGP